MQQYKKIKVIISGGGTGGHVFPAIAIADALKSKVEGIEILFVGALGRMEMEKVPAAGYKIIGLNVAGFKRSLSPSNLIVIFKLIGSLLKARRIIKDFAPDVAVGVGGYASGPVLRVATSMGIPAVIQEQNSYPGVTNKLLASRVDKICVAYRDMEKYFPKSKIYLTGNPVRKSVIDISGKKQQACRHFNIDENKQTILVVGGSLGARTINESVTAQLAYFKEKDIQVIWQTGKSYYDTAAPLALQYSNIRIYKFITEMDMAYAAADAIVSRAGAISVSEICAVKKPAILIPSPHVTEDHQTKNAQTLVNYNAALLLKDDEAVVKLGSVLDNLLNDKGLQESMARNMEGFGFRDAADTIAELIINTIKK